MTIGSFGYRVIRMRPKAAILLLVTLFGCALHSTHPWQPTRIKSSAKIFHHILQPISVSLAPYIDQNFIPIGPMLEKADTSSAPTRKEFEQLKLKIEKLDKNLVELSSQKSLTKFFDAFPKLELNPRTVETCSIFSFFIIGSIIGASLLDRLWLIGGIISAWWAAEAYHRDTVGGNLTRRVGVQLAQLILDIQEKFQQARSFYITGKWAYYGSKIWEQYDTQFGIQQRVDMFKKLAMQRATEFNTLFVGRDLSGQLYDFWQVLLATPVVVQKFDTRFGITSSLWNWGSGAVMTTGKWLRLFGNEGPGLGPGRPDSVSRDGLLWRFPDIAYGTGERKDSERGRRQGIQRLEFLQNLNGFAGVAVRKAVKVADAKFFAGRQRRRLAAIRGRPINPWTSPFDYLPGGKRSSTQRNS